MRVKEELPISITFRCYLRSDVRQHDTPFLFHGGQRARFKSHRYQDQ
jgi:hypothetical protein